MTDYQNSIWNWCRLEQIASFKQQRILTALSSISRSVVILWCFLWSSVPFLFFKLGKVIRVPLLISCPKVIFMYCRKRLKRWQSTSTTGRVPMWFRHFGGMLVQVNDIVYGSWSVLLLVVTLRGYEQNLCYRIPLWTVCIPRDIIRKSYMKYRSKVTYSMSHSMNIYVLWVVPTNFFTCSIWISSFYRLSSFFLTLVSCVRLYV